MIAALLKKEFQMTDFTMTKDAEGIATIVWDCKQINEFDEYGGDAPA
jgi:hypothetical protein